MHVSGILSLGALVATAVASRVASVSYDDNYDNSTLPLTRVACSDGDHGLITRYQWNVLKDVPRFPYIGGAQEVTGWDSPACGTCWRLEYKGRSVNILAVDHAGNGFNIARQAFKELVGGDEVGRVEVVSHKVDAKECGLH